MSAAADFRFLMAKAGKRVRPAKDTEPQVKRCKINPPEPRVEPPSFMDRKATDTDINFPEYVYRVAEGEAGLEDDDAIATFQKSVETAQSSTGVIPIVEQRNSPLRHSFKMSIAEYQKRNWMNVPSTHKETLIATF